MTYNPFVICCDAIKTLFICCIPIILAVCTISFNIFIDGVKNCVIVQLYTFEKKRCFWIIILELKIYCTLLIDCVNTKNLCINEISSMYLHRQMKNISALLYLFCNKLLTDMKMTFIYLKFVILSCKKIKMFYGANIYLLYESLL